MKKSLLKAVGKEITKTLIGVEIEKAGQSTWFGPRYTGKETMQNKVEIWVWHIQGSYRVAGLVRIIVAIKDKNDQT